MEKLVPWQGHTIAGRTTLVKVVLTLLVTYHITALVPLWVPFLLFRRSRGASFGQVQTRFLVANAN